MNEDLWNIVEKWREDGALILDEEAEEIHRFCLKKMVASKIENQEQYLPLLYADEIKNYLLRAYVNTVSILKRIEGCANV